MILLDSIDSSISSVYGHKITGEKHQKQIYRYTDTRPNSMNNEMICILCMKRHTSVFFYRIFFKRLSVLKWSSPCTKICISFPTYSCSIWSDNSYGEFRVMTKEWILISRRHSSCGELEKTPIQIRQSIFILWQNKTPLDGSNNEILRLKTVKCPFQFYMGNVWLQLVNLSGHAIATLREWQQLFQNSISHEYY